MIRFNWKVTPVFAYYHPFQVIVFDPAFAIIVSNRGYNCLPIQSQANGDSTMPYINIFANLAENGGCFDGASRLINEDALDCL